MCFYTDDQARQLLKGFFVEFVLECRADLVGMLSADMTQLVAWYRVTLQAVSGCGAAP